MTQQVTHERAEQATPRPMQRPARVQRTRRRARMGLVGVLVTALVAILGAGQTAGADELDDQRERTEAQAAATAAALKQLEGALEGTEQALADAYVELERIRAVIPIAERQLAEAEALVADLAVQAQIAADKLAAAVAEEQRIAALIAENDVRVEEIQAAIGRMAREAYRGDMAASSLTAMLDADSTEDFIEQSALSATALRTQTQAARELDQLTGIRNNQRARLEAVREEVAEAKALADAKLAEAEVARQAAAARRAELDVLLAQAEEKAQYIESQRQQELAQQAELEAVQAALANDLAAIIAEQQRRAALNGTTPGLAGNKPLSYPVPAPVVITSGYGNRLHPIYNVWRLHAGTDFRAYCGNPILAVADGTVQWARLRSGYGNQVLISHGSIGSQSIMTSYNHLSRFAVSSGQAVSRGQVIGYSGSTGSSTACHLHFEVYVNGGTVDPMGYVG